MQPTDDLQTLTKKTNTQLKWMLRISGILIVCLMICFFFTEADTAKLGQFGDFIGGILNPTIAFCALFALWKTTQIQIESSKQQITAEKERSIEERKRAESAQAETEKLRLHEAEKLHNEIFYRQFDAYLRLRNALKINTAPYKHKTSFLGAYIDPAGESCVSTAQNPIDYNIIKKTLLTNRDLRNLYPYFRLIHNILKNQYEKFENSNTIIQKSCINNINFFRAQLTDDELAWIGLNLLTEKGEGMFKYAAHFALLKHLEYENIRNNLNQHKPEEANLLFKENYPAHLAD